MFDLILPSESHMIHQVYYTRRIKGELYVRPRYFPIPRFESWPDAHFNRHWDTRSTRHSYRTDGRSFFWPHCSDAQFATAGDKAGEFCVLVDVQDTFDPASGAAAGIELSRRLLVRCGGNVDHALGSVASRLRRLAPRLLLQAETERAGIGTRRDRAIEDQVALVGQVGLAGVVGAQLRVGQERGQPPAVSRQPKRTTSTGRRVCWPSRSTSFGVSATTTNLRAAEITIFSRRSAPPPPLIRPTRGSTSSAPSSARSSAAVPVELHDLDAPRRELARALGGHGRTDAVQLCEELDHGPRRSPRAEAERHPRLDQRCCRCGGRAPGSQLAFAAHARSIAGAGSRASSAGSRTVSPPLDSYETE